MEYSDANILTTSELIAELERRFPNILLAAYSEEAKDGPIDTIYKVKAIRYTDIIYLDGLLGMLKDAISLAKLTDTMGEEPDEIV